MSRLTGFSRFLIVVGIVAAVYFVAKKFFPQLGSKTEIPALATGDAAASKPKEEQAEVPKMAAKERFIYNAPVPSNGKLKGVVELGASGFNMFIISVDAQKNWELKKADFGNSMVIENMATEDDIRAGLKRYIGNMLDFGVGGRDIHFVVSSGAVKAENTQKIMNVLKTMGYFVNTVTPEQEGKLGYKSVMPTSYIANAFVVDIGSGNTKMAWMNGATLTSLEGAGAKYFQKNESDASVYNDIRAKAAKVPTAKRKTCFIIGGVPFELAKAVRNGKERYTVLNPPADYQVENAKSKAGLNIYKAIADETGCKEFVFDWDANFTIGFLLNLPY